MTWTTPTNVSTGVASSSQFNTETVANLQHLYDQMHVWSDYTPSLSLITLGNGTLNGRYKQIGDIVHACVTLTFGSTTAITGSASIGLPVAAAYVEGSDSHAAVGVVGYLEAGVRRYTGHAVVATSTLAALQHTESGNGGSVNATAPFTWGTGDIIHLTITYEAA